MWAVPRSSALASEPGLSQASHVLPALRNVLRFLLFWGESSTAAGRLEPRPAAMAARSQLGLHRLLHRGTNPPGVEGTQLPQWQAQVIFSQPFAITLMHGWGLRVLSLPLSKPVRLGGQTAFYFASGLTP